MTKKKKIRVAFIGDTHGNLDLSIEPCDILFHLGDICEGSKNQLLSATLQSNWLNMKFRPWLAKQPVEECIAIAGNHDWIWYLAPHLVPSLGGNFYYLQDEPLTMYGLNIYGTPQQSIFLDWAFNRTDEQLKGFYANIPEGLDILLSHAPSYKIWDKVKHDNFTRHVGSKVLRDRIKEVRPKYVVTAHCHGQYGVKEVDGITYISCSILDEKYVMTRKPIYLEMEL